jgi:hypothetical protein
LLAMRLVSWTRASFMPRQGGRAARLQQEHPRSNLPCAVPDGPAAGGGGSAGERGSGSRARLHPGRRHVSTPQGTRGTPVGHPPCATGELTRGARDSLGQAGNLQQCAMWRRKHLDGGSTWSASAALGLHSRRMRLGSPRSACTGLP